MGSKFTKITTSEMFIRDYFDKNLMMLKIQYTPIRIYPLQEILRGIIVPFPMIKSDYNVIVFIRKGIYKQQIETLSADISENTIIFIPSGTIHSLLKMEQDIDGYILMIDDKVLSAIFNTDTLLNIKFIEPILSLNIVDSDWINNLCWLLYEEMKKEKPNRKISEGLLQGFLSKTLELSGQNQLLSREKQIATRFRHLVNLNFKKDKSVVFYANELSISTNYLNRCSKSLFGKSSKEIILETIIINSQLIMLDVSKNMTEVCYELNIEDVSYFSRIFKKITGKTPTQYKNYLMHDLS